MTDQPHPLNVVLVGESGGLSFFSEEGINWYFEAGKTALLERYVTNKFDDLEIQTTIGIDFKSVTIPVDDQVKLYLLILLPTFRIDFISLNF